MKKSAVRFLSIIFGAALIFGMSGSLWAQAPDIAIELNFGKDTYEIGDPIDAEIVVSNQSGGDILINKGFSSTVFYLEMRVIDPAERLVVATREDFHNEFPDAPPLSWILHNGKPIRVTGCESLPPGELPPSFSENLRRHYDIELPGYYSAQVQVSAMVFDGDPCEADSYAWQGVLSSETKYFYVQGGSGSAEVKIKPDKWELSWLKNEKKKKKKKKVKDVKVEIKLADGRAVADIDPESIRLNSMPYTKVKVERSKVKAYFDAKEALESLGDELKKNEKYSVIISGRMKSGELFGGEQQIKIVK